MTPTPFLGFSEPFSSISHLLTAFMSLIGIAFLSIRGRGNPTRMAALIIFSVSLVFLFSMSGVYHLLTPGTVARDVLQRLDHAGIWVLIAGTFTPIHIILFRGPWRWAVLLLIWVLAITGLVLEVVFFTDFPEALSLSLYLGLGWIGAVSGVRFTKLYGDRSVRLLIAGGLFYSVGAIFDFSNWPILIDGVIGPHEIFHVFVIAGAASHWLFIYNWSEHPVINTITVNIHILPPNRFIARVVNENIEIEANDLNVLKIKIHERIKSRFHHTITPRLHLRYFEEEYI